MRVDLFIILFITHVGPVPEITSLR